MKKIFMIKKMLLFYKNKLYVLYIGTRKIII